MRCKLICLVMAAALSAGLCGCAVYQSQDVHGKTGEVTEPVSDRNYYIYLPANYSTTRKYPLVVSIHGMKPFDNAFPQLETWRKICDENNWIAIAPQLKSPDIANQFPFRRVDAAIIDDETEIVASVQDACRRYSVDARYIMMTGWSSGGYLIHYTAARHPELFTMIAPQGANFSEDIMPQYITDAAREMPVYIYHGSADLPLVISDTNAAVRWYARHGYKNVKMDEAPGGHERHPELAARYFINLMHDDTNGAIAARTVGGAGAANWLGTTSPIVASKLAGSSASATLAGTTGGRPLYTPTSGLVARSTGDLPAGLASSPAVASAPPGRPAGIASAGTPSAGMMASNTPPAALASNSVPESPRPRVPASSVVPPPPPGRVSNLPTPATVVPGPVAAKTTTPPATVGGTGSAGPPAGGAAAALAALAAPAAPAAPVAPTAPVAMTATLAANPGLAPGAVIGPSDGSSNPYGWDRIGPSKPVDVSRFAPSGSSGGVASRSGPAEDPVLTKPPSIVGAGVAGGTPTDLPPAVPAVTPSAGRTDDGGAKVASAPVVHTGVVTGSVAPLGPLPTATVALPVDPAAAKINPGGKSVPARSAQSLNDVSRFAPAPVSAEPVVPTLAVAAPRPMTPSNAGPSGKIPDPATDRVNPAARMIPVPATTLTAAYAAGPQGVPAASNLLCVRILPSVQEGGAPLTVEFRAEIRGINSPIVKYRWRLADNLFSTSHFGVLTFQQAGQYPVELVVTDAAGNTYHGTTTIRVAG